MGEALRPANAYWAPTLLLGGIFAGPIYMAVSLAQAFTRPAFDITRHPFSLLTQGDLGWLSMVLADASFSQAAQLARTAGYVLRRFQIAPQAPVHSRRFPALELVGCRPCAALNH